MAAGEAAVSPRRVAEGGPLSPPAPVREVLRRGILGGEPGVELGVPGRMGGAVAGGAVAGGGVASGADADGPAGEPAGGRLATPVDQRVVPGRLSPPGPVGAAGRPAGGLVSAPADLRDDVASWDGVAGPAVAREAAA
jgi:hypothetical protein